MPYGSSGSGAVSSVIGDRAAAVDGDRGREDETLDAVVHGGVDQVDAADDVVRVVEALDEVAQALGGIGREVIHVIEAALGEESIDGRVIDDAGLDEASVRPARCRRKPPLKSSSTTT